MAVQVPWRLFLGRAFVVDVAVIADRAGAKRRMTRGFRLLEGKRVVRGRTPVQDRQRPDRHRENKDELDAGHTRPFQHA